MAVDRVGPKARPFWHARTLLATAHRVAYVCATLAQSRHSPHVCGNGGGGRGHRSQTRPGVARASALPPRLALGARGRRSWRDDREGALGRHTGLLCKQPAKPEHFALEIGNASLHPASGRVTRTGDGCGPTGKGQHAAAREATRLNGTHPTCNFHIEGRTTCSSDSSPFPSFSGDTSRPPVCFSAAFARESQSVSWPQASHHHWWRILYSTALETSGQRPYPARYP